MPVIGVWDQLRAVARLRLAITRHQMAAWRQESRFKRIVLPVILVLLWGVWLAGCGRAFYYVLLFPGIGPILVERLMALMFAAVFAMLVMSTIVTSLTTLYHAPEVGALLVLPLSSTAIFIVKAIEVSLLAGWAPLFFLGPVVLAYGLMLHRSWSYYVTIGIALPWFLALACMVGLLLVVLLARWCPRWRWSRWWLSVPVVGALWLVWLACHLPDTPDVSTTQVITIANQLFHHTAFIRWPWNPTYWLTESLTAAMRSQWSRAVGMGAVLVSTAFLAAQLLEALASRQYFASWSRVSSWPTAHRVRSTVRQPFLRWRWPWARTIQWLIMVKDARLFVRDPAQWSHVVIFFGMLAVYILNLRTMPYNLSSAFWQHTIAFLNLAATTLTMAMLNVRFIFPQLSLEGRRAWIMRLAPVSWAQILDAKWWAGVIGSLLVTEVLVVGSSLMLRLTPRMMSLACAVILVMCCAIVGLAVGLGARYPNFKQDNPARIISGFGGTLLLVLTLAYVAVMMCLGATPLQWWVHGALQSSVVLQRIAWGLGALALGCSGVAALVPLRIGLRHVERQEF